MKDDNKTSADYQRAYRDRMRELGLVKKEVWIRPEYADELAAVEKKMREAEAAGLSLAAVAPAASPREAWTVQSLYQALLACAPVQNGSVQVEYMEGADPILHLVIKEFGDLPIFIAVGHEQILVESVMWSLDEVADESAFNKHVLGTHRILPLSNIGIDMINGVACYVMYGALDVRSSFTSLLFEVETLAMNVINAVDAYGDHLLSTAKGEMQA